MPTANLVLEYLKVALSTQVVAGLIFLLFLVFFKSNIKKLIDRVGGITLPGGGGITMSQMENTKVQDSLPPQQSPPNPTSSTDLPKIDLDPTQKKQIEEILVAEQARAALWEYRYLNYYLVRATQEVLNWLISLKMPTTIRLADDWWMKTIPDPNERKAIFEALRSHNLIEAQNDQIIVTPKGREYAQWRGPLPQIPTVA